MYGIDDTRKIGFGLSAAGLLFTVLGVLLFFDRGLLGLGNVRAKMPVSAKIPLLLCDCHRARPQC